MLRLQRAVLADELQSADETACVRCALHIPDACGFAADPRGPMSALPLIIYEFARSPYAEQQKLAWTGALILTFAVLALSILARIASASVKQK